MNLSNKRGRANSVFGILATIVAIATLSSCGGSSSIGQPPPPPPVTATETVLYAFKGTNGGATDGLFPNNSPMLDAAGNLYGTAMEGGTGALPANTTGPAPGIVFKIDTSNHESTLYSFQGPSSGAFPSSAVAIDSAGNLFATTLAGGPDTFCGLQCGSTNGSGTVIKLDSSGNETTLYSFKGQNGDGQAPITFISDGAGNFYGITAVGGSLPCWCGTVFKVDSSGNETVLHSFTGQNGDGNISGAGWGPGWPGTNLVLDSAGNLYGETYGGGGSPNCTVGCGTVFKLDSLGNETILHSFGGPPDGKYPTGLLMDKAGNLYGTTWEGGTSTNCGQRGCGTIFKIDTSGNETVLYNFASSSSSDGEGPASLLMDSSGDFFGVSLYGGTSANCSQFVTPFAGCGTFFKLDSAGHESVLYSFKGAPSGDGSVPTGLVMSSSGNFYGTTSAGGVICSGVNSGCGTVFKIASH